MRSVLRSVRKRKKSRRLGEVDIISREEYAGFDVDAKVKMIRALVPLGLMHVQELLDDEVTELAGARHARKESLVRGRRHGSNSGRSASRANACRSGFRACAASREARFPCVPPRRRGRTAR